MRPVVVLFAISLGFLGISTGSGTLNTPIQPFPNPAPTPQSQITIGNKLLP